MRKNLAESRLFVDDIWSRFRRDSQYQLEETRNWASHLKHLQSILLEFDIDGAPKESDLIRFFQEGLKPSIKAQMEQKSWDLDAWEEMIEKAVECEAKAGLQPASYIREMDHQALQENCPAHITTAKILIQSITIKDSRIKAPKLKA